MTEGTVYSMLILCCISHFLNDMIQSIIPSIYPIIKEKYNFSFAQIGVITLVFQMTSSILQPFTGLYADKHPRPYALSIGMCFTLTGLILLAFAEQYLLILIAVGVVGLGSSIFHPTASRVAQLASGGEKKLGSIHLPSRGKRGQCFRSSACRHDCFAIRATCHLLVRHCRITGSPCHDKIGGLVQSAVAFCREASPEGYRFE